jgi:two-component system response regulator AgrA
LNIFVLEDDIFQRKKIEQIIMSSSDKMDVRIEKLISTGKSAELIDSIMEQGSHQLYFLDIDIKKSEKRGLEIAKEIREKDELGTIVFVTTHSEFAPLTYAYKVSALEFISKEDPNFEKRLEGCISYVNKRSQAVDFDDPFIFENKYRKFKMPFSDVLYFETSDQPHKIILISKKKRFEFYAKLSDIESKDSRLFKCHKSFVVNLENVVELDKTNLLVYFSNGESCLVSRRKIKHVTEWLSKGK